ncbi:hypothetical protein P154DRAFT_442146 [Amniculicola lignicola CBS 123094]|uniref:Rhodopsin domain-containing protein n=1 Tax=Amniculicola lignicola CBS 123094 TaxID=1392246 RepID=A0A6A5WA77_9PLEO|nr:hypothetical protein P154DRAFT_442146 [Amniculicola lignicola CBS 123094]
MEASKAYPGFELNGYSKSWILESSTAPAHIGYSSLVPAVVFTILAACAVAARWYTRLHLVRTWGIEDIILTTAVFHSAVMTGIIGAESNFQTPLKDSPNYEAKAGQIMSNMLKLVFAQTIIFHIAINLTKAAIVTQYLRIFSRTTLAWRIPCYVLLLLILGSAGWGVFGVAFICSPAQKYWKPDLPGMCRDLDAHFVSSAIIGIILDFAIWVLPMRLVWSLKVSRAQRWSLALVFGLGAFVCITSIVRLVLTRAATVRGDVTGAGTNAMICSTLEVNVGIICASLMVLKPLVMRWFPQWGRSDTQILTRKQKKYFRDVLWGESLWNVAASEEEVIEGCGKNMDACGKDGGVKEEVNEIKRRDSPYALKVLSMR